MKRQAGPVQFCWDSGLLSAVIVLGCLGLVMVYSASVHVAEHNESIASYHYLLRQTVFLGLGALLGFVVSRISMKVWEDYYGVLLAVSLLALIGVLIPGVGTTINGSARWISLGFFNVQPSEIAKLSMIIYTASFVSARQRAGTFNGTDMLAPMIILAAVCALLLLEPDLGSAVVLGTAVLGMLFLGGISLMPFIAIMTTMVGSAVLAIVSSDYRLSRVLATLDPWSDPFNGGYQLVQALIAFGQGGWTGVGLGSSVQKLSYLPESHTDFLIAVMAEELGLIAVIGVLCLYLYVTIKGLSIAAAAMKNNRCFSGMVAYGIALLITIQALINIGVNMGVLPTKGLTLPLMSYGGSSVVMNCIAIAMLLRIDHENRLLVRRR